MAYSFYFNEYLLPVTPGSVDITYNDKDEKTVLINEAEVNFLRDRGLTGITFPCLLPNFRYPFAYYLGNFKPAAYFLDLFMKMKDDKEPIQFIVSRLGPSGELLFDTNITVSIGQWRTREAANEQGFDIVVDMNLLQYRDFGTKQVGVTRPNPDREGLLLEVKQNRPIRGLEVPRVTEAGVGDSLWSIARKILNDGENFANIYTLNSMVIDAVNQGTGGSMYNIPPGISLNMPLRQSPRELFNNFAPDRLFQR